MKIVEEFFAIRDGNRLAVVADGMGGHRAGDVASSNGYSIIPRLLEANA